MRDKHVVRFEPVGIEIEVDEEETILRAAAAQGVTLMHGCKEGQCASCKSFVLDGEDPELDRYSTFALPDYEKDEGYTLLCRAHVYEDVVIELLNYDEEMMRSGHPIQNAVAEVAAIEQITHDLRHLVLMLVEPDEVAYWPGQYMDFTIPGTDESRSFSMANPSTKESGQLEFVIKVYPEGRFSQLLDTGLTVGDRLELVGPYGVFTLRDRDSRIVFLGGGAGMAPILCLLRTLGERGSSREVAFYYGARTRADLCFEKELAALGESLSNFTFVPALSEPGEDDDWAGEVGMITDVLERHETDLSAADCYVCGPPPMVDAALDLLPALKAESGHIYYDKFTTTAPS